MSINTYTELKTAIADWLNRDDVSDARLADFIAMAENRIFRQLRIKELEASHNLVIDSQGKAALPADHLEPKDVLWNDKPLGRVSLTSFYTNEATQGTPVYFARERDSIKLWPIPVEGDPGGRLIYYARPVNLSDVQLTNAVFAAAPELYLYGALVEAGVYLSMDQAKTAIWDSRFSETIDLLTQQSRQSDVSGATMLIDSGY